MGKHPKHWLSIGKAFPKCLEAPNTSFGVTVSPSGSKQRNISNSSMQTPSQNNGEEEICHTSYVNVSFAGCGFLGLFHVGAVAALREHRIKVDRAYGASAGSIAAMSLLSDIETDFLREKYRELGDHVRAVRFGAFNPMFRFNELFMTQLKSHVPDDVSERVTNRLHVSMSTLSLSNVMVNTFASRDELIQALTCSCFLPGYSGLVPPKFRGVSYIDGGYSVNQPVADEKTITISPFAGNAVISPQDGTTVPVLPKWVSEEVEMTTHNLQRFVGAVIPADDEDQFHSGYELTKAFIESGRIKEYFVETAMQS